MQAKRETHGHAPRGFFLSCMPGIKHDMSSFSPVSRFYGSELEEAVNEMEELMGLQNGVERTSNETATSMGGVEDTGPSSASKMDMFDLATAAADAGDAEPSTRPLMATRKPLMGLAATLVEPGLDNTFKLEDSAPLSRKASDGLPIPSLPIKFYSDAELTEDVFCSIWLRGDPLVVSGLLPKFRIQWTPQYFMEKYGKQMCHVLDCQTDETKNTTVREFFSGFGKYEGRKNCWKLKVCRRGHCYIC
jgi:[histone H3]-dimethyl-L-lysine9 demethylase